MTDFDMVQETLASLPADIDRIIVIYPTGKGTSACRWFGMSAEGVAETLYSVADSVVDQRIPMKERH